jgi:NAD(P)-dependent dehydrogenase (short-subunit alcohol dehydrogenase family)
VIISSRKAPACDETAAEINAAFGKAGDPVAHAIPANINSRGDLQRLADESTARWGKVDVLVCNAAVNPYFGPGAGIPEDAFDNIMSANVKSNFQLCNMIMPQMTERRDGSIIIVSSIAGLRGSTVLGAYAISKAADLQLVRNLAVEYGPMNVRANAIVPGLVKTYFARALWENDEILTRATSNAPLKRIGEPDEIAGAAVFLASKAGAFMTGQSIVLDGGVTAA